jgi:hypothetical protein
MFHVVQMEWWNVDLNKEVTHLLNSMAGGILTILHIVQNKFIHCYIFSEPIIPSLQYSNWG